MMKILQVTGTFAPMWEFGGVARVSYELSSRFAKQCHDVTVYTINRNKEYHLTENVQCHFEDIKTYYFGMFGLKRFTRRVCVLPSLRSLSVIKKDCSNYDIIHVHDYRSMLAVIVTHYARKYHVPYIIQAHGSLPRLGKVGLKSVFDKVWGKRILNGAAATIALSSTEEQSYLDLGVKKERIHIIPNGIDSDYFPLPEKGCFRAKYSLSDSCQLVTFVGRLHPSKGIEMLIEAFSKIKLQSEMDTRLVLVGAAASAEYQKKIDNLIAKHHLEDTVILTGFVSVTEKKEALVDSNVFVTPSYSGFPVTFLEACACQVPIVTTKNGDDLGWINGQVGYVTEFSVIGLSEGILTVLCCGDDIDKFKEMEHRLVRGMFGWSRIVVEYNEIYNEYGLGGCRYVA